MVETSSSTNLLSPTSVLASAPFSSSSTDNMWNSHTHSERSSGSYQVLKSAEQNRDNDSLFEQSSMDRIGPNTTPINHSSQTPYNSDGSKEEFI